MTGSSQVGSAGGNRWAVSRARRLSVICVPSRFNSTRSISGRQQHDMLAEALGLGVKGRLDGIAQCLPQLRGLRT